MLKIVLIIVG